MDWLTRITARQLLAVGFTMFVVAVFAYTALDDALVAIAAEPNEEVLDVVSIVVPVTLVFSLGLAVACTSAALVLYGIGLGSRDRSDSREMFIKVLGIADEATAWVELESRNREIVEQYARTHGIGISEALNELLASKL